MSESITEGLMTDFSRVGFPETILSDQGTQFISTATQEVTKSLVIAQLFSCPYHSQTNGICKQFNGTPK